MSVTVRSMIIALMLIIVAGFLYRISGVSGQLSEEEINQRYPTFEATNFTGDYFDTSGQMSYSINTANMSYYKRKETVNTGVVKATYYDHKDLTKPNRGWILSADSSLIVLNKFAILEGNIRVVPNFSDSLIKEVATPNVYFNMVQNTLSSRDQITIRGEQFINQGSNYLVDLNRKTFVIKDQPHAVYFPTPIALSSDGMQLP